MLVDASPLIYLAKLDALEIFEGSGHVPLLTPEIERETARPALAYEHPDSVLIAEALRLGKMERTEVTDEENRIAQRLQEQTSALKVGEAQVLAAAQSRSRPVLLSERRALRLAVSLGLEVWVPLDLLIAGTAEPIRLRERILGLARLTDMSFADVEIALRKAEVFT